MAPYAVGFRFVPTDQELLEYYLYRKLQGEPLPSVSLIPQELLFGVDALQPHQLFDVYSTAPPEAKAKEELYFFTPINKKHARGTNVERIAGDGTWDMQRTYNVSSSSSGLLIGYRTHLSFKKQGCWVMHLYTLKDFPLFGLCRIKRGRDRDPKPTPPLSQEDAPSPLPRPPPRSKTKTKAKRARDLVPEPPDPPLPKKHRAALDNNPSHPPLPPTPTPTPTHCDIPAPSHQHSTDTSQLITSTPPPDDLFEFDQPFSDVPAPSHQQPTDTAHFITLTPPPPDDLFEFDDRPFSDVLPGPSHQQPTDTSQFITLTPPPPDDLFEFDQPFGDVLPGPSHQQPTDTAQLTTSTPPPDDLFEFDQPFWDQFSHLATVLDL